MGTSESKPLFDYVSPLAMTTVNGKATKRDGKTYFSYTTETSQEVQELATGEGADPNAVLEPCHYLANLKTVGEDKFEGEEISEHDFKHRLATTDAAHIFFFVHGFNTQPIEVLEQAKKLTNKFKAHEGIHGRVEVIPVNWPCGDRIGLVRPYRLDQGVARNAARGIASIFKGGIDPETVTARSTLRKRKVHTMFHSMGNRVGRFLAMEVFPSDTFPNTVTGAEKYEDSVTDPTYKSMLDNCFLVGADVPATIFSDEHARDEGGAALSTLYDHVHVVHASGDLPLISSQTVNLGARLGQGDGAKDVSSGIVVNHLDASAFNGKYDRLLGHSYHMGDENIAYMMEAMARSEQS